MQVKRFSKEKSFPADSKNIIFIADSKWDEQIEKESINIETDFQKLIDEDDILGKCISKPEKQRFFSLCLSISFLKWLFK